MQPPAPPPKKNIYQYPYNLKHLLEKNFHSRSKQLAKVAHIHQGFSIITLDSTKTHNISEAPQVINTGGQKQ